MPYFDMESESCHKISKIKKPRLEEVYSEASDLHVAQTLDRSYYLGLKSTEDRDYDQVVSRYTSASWSTWNENKLGMTAPGIRIQTEAGRPRSGHNADSGPYVPRQIQMPGNEPLVSLLMVNQLWMWKIDDRKRYCLSPQFCLTGF
jgi:hypothetical protein